LDGDRIVVDVERAGRLARGGADAAGDFGEIVGGVQIARGLLPVAAIDEVVPIRDLLVDRTPGRRAGQDIGAVAIRNAAIHAARGLCSCLLFGQRQHELAPVLYALFDRLVMAVIALVLKEAGNLAHATPPPAWCAPCRSRRARGGIRAASPCRT